MSKLLHDAAADARAMKTAKLKNIHKGHKYI